MNLNGSVFVILIVLLSLAPFKGFGGTEIGLFAGGSSKKIGGSVGLKSGLGLELGVIVPFSRILEFNGTVVLPRKYDVSDPEGQIFSVDGYNKSYSSLQYFSMSGGTVVYINYLEDQKFVPFAGFDMGKSWIMGSGRDGFSGLSIGWTAGVRYNHEENWRFEVSYSRLTTDLDKIKLDGEVTDITTDESVHCSSVCLTAVYRLIFADD